MNGNAMWRILNRGKTGRACSLLVLAGAAGVAAGCSIPTALTRLVEARRSAAEMHVQFALAADASNRAVMADTDDGAAAAADEARQARRIVGRNIEALKTTFDALGYTEDRTVLDRFASRFAEYQRLDDEILPLAVENTNVKAQQLSFGASRQSADEFAAALDRALKAGGGDPWRGRTLAARAANAVLRIQVLYAPHIAEANLEAMSQMEAQMTAAATDARAAVGELEAALPAAAGPSLADAKAALERFEATRKTLIALSRRNSDVNSLALSLGRKRTLAAACQEQLVALDEALARHQFTATR